jgi:hypothetical protein
MGRSWNQRGPKHAKRRKKKGKKGNFRCQLVLEEQPQGELLFPIGFEGKRKRLWSLINALVYPTAFYGVFSKVCN